ncbi:GNAT family N-acetyltransferase [Microbacterium sp. NPDC076911]|uniref:GNAT family N-acetyltransferase n=1 Tax=Microbacterium sp. NPDC076911 TaxID=3154958 RepID=UPI00342360D1
MAIEIVISALQPADAGEVLTVQRAAFVSEAIIYRSVDMPPFTQTLAEVESELRETQGWAARVNGRLVGAIRARSAGGRLLIGRIAIAPDMQGRGIGQALLEAAERNTHAVEAELFTGSLSEANIRLYESCGYVESERVDKGDGIEEIYLRKKLRSSP